MIESDLVDKIMEKMSSDAKNRRQVFVFCSFFLCFFALLNTLVKSKLRED